MAEGCASLPAYELCSALYHAQPQRRASTCSAVEIDMEVIDEYIHKKRKEENLSQFGFMHVIIAAYVRVISQRPGLNRFIAGQRIFHRNEIVACMIVKKSMELDAQESDIKLSF